MKQKYGAQCNLCDGSLEGYPDGQTICEYCKHFRSESALSQELELKQRARYFPTGATRDTDEGKLDYEGFLSPFVLKRFAEYMHECRKQSDGVMRDSDNWQKGIPQSAYMKSLWRHFIEVWTSYREGEPSVEALCALLFNVQGMMHELLKPGGATP